MDEVLVGSLLDVVVGQAGLRSGPAGASVKTERRTPGKRAASQMVFQGGDAPRSVGTYVPVMQKPRMESVEVVNARYLQRKGLERGDEETRAMGFRRLVGGEAVD